MVGVPFRYKKIPKFHLITGSPSDIPRPPTVHSQTARIPYCTVLTACWTQFMENQVSVRYYNLSSADLPSVLVRMYVCGGFRRLDVTLVESPGGVSAW